MAGGPIIIPEEEAQLAAQAQQAQHEGHLMGSPAPAAPASAALANPFAWPEEEAAAPPGPVATKPLLNASAGGGASLGDDMPTPPWQQQAAAMEAALEELGRSEEEVQRADALGAANDCREFGWVVQRLPYSAQLPLLPRDLAGAQLEARRARKKK